MEATDIAEFTALLATADLDQLQQTSPAALCEVITALELAKNAACAAQARATVVAASALREQAIADGAAPERADKGIRQQIGLARRESTYAGGRHLGFARAVVHEMPHTHAAMTEGWIGEWTAMELVRETACLAREHREVVDARLSERLPVDSHKKLVAAARAMAYELDPYSFVNQGRKAATHRRVSVRPAPEVMSIVTGFLPVAQGVACYKALDDAARSLRAAGDERTLDQLRADLFAERLTGKKPADDVDIELGLVMTDTALLGLDETAARLEHFGPLPAPMARDLLRGRRDGTTEEPEDPTDAGALRRAATEAVVWLRRLYADPVTGVLTSQDSRRRLFTGALRRFLVARDQVCRTPWCDAPVRHADHILPFARGGTTTEDNGQGTCEACNYDKEAPGWRHETVESGEGAHVVRVTTPTGHTYESHAPPVLPTLGLTLARPPARQPRAPSQRVPRDTPHSSGAAPRGPRPSGDSPLEHFLSSLIPA
ncbi:HNH endonuclease [Ornithinimicrobium cavernae]|uniref:HNH endonuclease n=1 Tax=Ornithinimicrobium cavernae TaxID=2666047 RepID=UPI000D6987D5|nr:HNH endonuclease signature motif containing protein [Ornithinimicrobium cavernae]